MAEFPAPKEGIVLTRFIVSDDVERSRRFNSEVLGGEVVRDGEPSFVALAKVGSSSTSVAGPPMTSRLSRSRPRRTRIA